MEFFDHANTEVVKNGERHFGTWGKTVQYLGPEIRRGKKERRRNHKAKI